jgi:hypothetical protein
MGSDTQNLPGVSFNSDHFVYSNYFVDNHIVQQSAVVHPKNLIIDALRQYFARDNVYTYRYDEYGYPLTPDITGLDVNSPETTKILISDVYRYEVKFYPAIVVKFSGGSYKPISMNQNGTLKYRTDIVEDSFGGRRQISTPTHRVYAGAWDLNFNVDIFCESHTELQELVDITTILLQYSLWNDLRASGLFIKGLSFGGENAEQYANDYVYSQSITLNCRSEWRVEIPIDSIVEKIVFNIESTKTPSFGKTEADVVGLQYKDLLEITEI